MDEFENRPYPQNAPADERARRASLQSGPHSGMAREREEQSEGRVARAIESQTARAPSDWFLWAALAAMATAAAVQLREQKQWSLFLGQWAAPLLLFGLYNKIVKVAGSDRAQGDGPSARAAY